MVKQVEIPSDWPDWKVEIAKPECELLPPYRVQALECKMPAEPKIAHTTVLAIPSIKTAIDPSRYNSLFQSPIPKGIYLP